MYTLETAKELAKTVLANLIHYPRMRSRFYPDDVTTVAIALMKSQNQARETLPEIKLDLAALINNIADQIKDWDIPDSDIVSICPDRYSPNEAIKINMQEFRALLDKACRAFELEKG